MKNVPLNPLGGKKPGPQTFKAYPTGSFTTSVLPWLLAIGVVVAIALSTASFIIVLVKAGPRGKQGEQGPQGPKGQDGLSASSSSSASGLSGPGSSTDNAIARWDGTSGDTLQDSSATIDDSGNAIFAASVGVASAAAFGGGGALVQRKKIVEYGDTTGTLTAADIVHSNIVFVGITARRIWAFPATASVDALLPLANTTGAYWSFLIINSPSSTAEVNMLGVGDYDVWGAKNETSSETSIIPPGYMSITHIWRTSSATSNPLNNVWNVFLDLRLMTN